MGLKILPGNDGRPRPMWYARFNRNGKQMNINLNVPIRGEIPTDDKGRFSLRLKGSPAFERSRQAALKAFAEIQHNANRRIAANRDLKAEAEAGLLKASYKVLTGEGMSSIRLDELPAKWSALKRTYTPTQERTQNYTLSFERFAKFAARHATEQGKTCETINDVTPEIANAYFEHLKSNYAWGTVRDQTNLLSSAFRRWATNGQPNPFGGIIKRNRELASLRVNRRPLTAAETERLFALTEENPNLHALVICAACTGMRIGDCCNLKWADVDLNAGFIDVITAKAGVRVTLPIFAPLRRELESLLLSEGNDPHVFPWAAETYARNRTAIIRAVKPFFAKAVFPNVEPEEAQLTTTKPKKPLPVGEILDIIEKSTAATGKKNRMREIFLRFKAGDKPTKIAESLGIARGQVSDYLAEVEILTGETYRPRIAKQNLCRRSASQKEAIRLTRQERTIGKNAASLYGWHSLRASFVVLAVEAGVSLPDIQSVVGHSTVEMTMQYYHPTKRHAAERVARQMQNSILNTEHTTIANLSCPANIPKDVWSILTDDQKRKLIHV